MFKGRLKWASLVLFTALFSLWPSALASAAGCETPPFPVLAERVEGPYAVAVGVMPTAEPTVGRAKLLVRVCDAAAGTPLEGVRVSLWPVNPEGVRGGVILALGRFAGPGDYSADVMVREAGSWRYQIELEGTLGRAQFEVPLEVRGLSSYGGWLPTVVFMLASAALLGGGIYLYSRTR